MAADVVLPVIEPLTPSPPIDGGSVPSSPQSGCLGATHMVRLVPGASGWGCVKSKSRSKGGGGAGWVPLGLLAGIVRCSVRVRVRVRVRERVRVRVWMQMRMWVRVGGFGSGEPARQRNREPANPRTSAYQRIPAHASVPVCQCASVPAVAYSTPLFVSAWAIICFSVTRRVISDLIGPGPTRR